MKIITTRTRDIVREIKLDRPISANEADEIYERVVDELYDEGFNITEFGQYNQELDIDIEDCYYRAHCGTIYYKPIRRVLKVFMYDPSTGESRFDESRLLPMDCNEYWFDEGQMKPTGAKAKFTWKDLEEMEEVIW